MIRLVFALRKKPGLSLEQFQEYWRSKHGPLVASFAEDMNVLRYVQAHTIDDGSNEAAQQAREGRVQILEEMAKGLSAAREGVSQHAPRIETMTVNKDKIRDIIGPGGKMIREICEVTGTKIDIEDDGTVKVAAVDGNAMQQAIDWIRGLTAEPEVGQIYEGQVVKIVDFGAFVNYMGNKDGLVHISELADHRVGKVTDIIKEGDKVKAKLIGIDDRGKVKLSMRMVDQETGEDISDQVKPKGERA